jgi:hypothetical protein
MAVIRAAGDTAEAAVLAAVDQHDGLTLDEMQLLDLDLSETLVRWALLRLGDKGLVYWDEGSPRKVRAT